MAWNDIPVEPGKLVPIVTPDHLIKTTNKKRHVRPEAALETARRAPRRDFQMADLT